MAARQRLGVTTQDLTAIVTRPYPLGRRSMTQQLPGGGSGASYAKKRRRSRTAKKLAGLQQQQQQRQQQQLRQQAEAKRASTAAARSYFTDPDTRRPLQPTATLSAAASVATSEVTAPSTSKGASGRRVEALSMVPVASSRGTGAGKAAGGTAAGSAKATVPEDYAMTRSPGEMAAQYGRGWTQGWGEEDSVVSRSKGSNAGSKAGSKGSRAARSNGGKASKRRLVVGELAATLAPNDLQPLATLLLNRMT